MEEKTCTKTVNNQPTWTGFVTYEGLKTGGQRRGPYQIHCDKVLAGEVHRPHRWIYQPYENAPWSVDALCFGYCDGSWYLNFVPF